VVDFGDELFYSYNYGNQCVIIIIIINEFHRDASLTKLQGRVSGGAGVHVQMEFLRDESFSISVTKSEPQTSVHIILKAG